MDKLSVPISFKVSPSIFEQIQELALEEGSSVSLFCRKTVIEKLHQSKFRMKDYLKNSDESQDD